MQKRTEEKIVAIVKEFGYSGILKESVEGKGLDAKVLGNRFIFDYNKKEKTHTLKERFVVELGFDVEAPASSVEAPLVDTNNITQEIEKEVSEVPEKLVEESSKEVSEVSNQQELPKEEVETKIELGSDIPEKIEEQVELPSEPIKKAQIPLKPELVIRNVPSLKTLRVNLEEKGYKIISFNGYELVTNVGSFTLASEVLYLDHKEIDPKTL